MASIDTGGQAQPGTDTGAQAPDTQVSHGLNLHLQLADPRRMPELMMRIAGLRDAAHQALEQLHFVHFARFLPLRDQSALLVITEFDGPLDPYALDFVIAIGNVFDMLLSFVKDAPPLPVREHPEAFMEFVRKYNRVLVAPCTPAPGTDYPIYSAYRDRTVIDIVGQPTTPLPPVADAASAALPLADVQGNVLRGFRATRGRHFALRVPDAARGKEFLAELLGRGKDPDFPRVTSAAAWEEGKLHYFLNVGITCAGLRALGVAEADLRAMPEAFVQGPAARADANGDRGVDAPAGWALGAPGQDVHLFVSLYEPGAGGRSRHHALDGEFSRRAKQIDGWCHASGFHVQAFDVDALPAHEVHFGYRDGISAPRIAGLAEQDGGPDKQPLASPGEFLLGAGYTGIYSGTSLCGMPAPLCDNGTFAAVRMMEQHVGAFHAFLREQAKEHNPEWIAAKLMGRWRDGTPLTLAPHAPQGQDKPHPPQSDANDFDYAPRTTYPEVPNDHEGQVCPLGAHIRRMNPRGSLVAGRPYTRRLMRRGMPYGPRWKDGQAEDGKPRGLFGLFLCADLERQYEFLLQEWAQGARGMQASGTADPVIGPKAGDVQESSFVIPVKNEPSLQLQVPRLVTTRGSVYLLMPGLAALGRLASGTTEVAVPVPAGGFDPAAFDPKDAGFLADPYPFYAKFRQSAPVALVSHGAYRSYWVFSHELVTLASEDKCRFLKEAPDDAEKLRGLFFMDPPRHTQVRAVMDVLFARAIRGIADVAMDEARQAIADIRAGGRSFDLIAGYSNRVSRNVFMRMFGVPAADWPKLAGWIDTIMQTSDQMVAGNAHAGDQAKLQLGQYFQTLVQQCPAHAQAQELFCPMAGATRKGYMQPEEFIKTAAHFAMGGYLSTDFLIGTAIRNLLARPAALAAFRAAKSPGRRKALEENQRFDAPFQMADRFAAEDTTLGGCFIPRGALVTLVYGSANHDEQVFGATAEEFDARRDIAPGSNYVFGHGIHYCIGAPMADQVAPVAIEMLLDEPALANLALDAQVPAPRYDNPYFRGFARLMLQY